MAKQNSVALMISSIFNLLIFFSQLKFQILLSATLTHDPEPLKRFRLNFPRLFSASSTTSKTSSNGVTQEENDKDALPGVIHEDIALGKEIDYPDGTREAEDTAIGVGVFSTPCGLKEFFVELTERQKPMFLAHLIKTMGHEKILCFTNSREATRRLAVLMSHFDGVKAGALNAGMPLQKRTRLLSSFAGGDFQVLNISLFLQKSVLTWFLYFYFPLVYYALRYCEVKCMYLINT